MPAPKTNLGTAGSLAKVVQRQHILKELETRDCTLEEFAAQHGLTRKTLYNLRKKKVEATEDLLDARHFGRGRPARRDDRSMAWALSYKESHPQAAIKQIQKHIECGSRKLGFVTPPFRPGCFYNVPTESERTQLFFDACRCIGHFECFIFWELVRLWRESRWQEFAHGRESYPKPLLGRDLKWEVLLQVYSVSMHFLQGTFRGVHDLNYVGSIPVLIHVISWAG